MKKVLALMITLVVAFAFSVVSFAAEPDAEPTAGDILEHSAEAAELNETPVDYEGTEDITPRLLHTVATGDIAAGGKAVVFSNNPALNEVWTIGRQSGSAGKIDIEVRNAFGVVLGSKAFSSDGDGVLQVAIPWDAGTCTVTVYNHTGSTGSWTLAIAKHLS